MGTDIHGWVEYKYQDCYRSIVFLSSPLRNYPLWGLMAGARARDALIEPRGWPEDCCHYARSNDHVTLLADHTHSWLTTEEFEKAYRVSVEQGGDDMQDDEAEALIALMKELPDARIVFAFDN